MFVIYTMNGNNIGVHLIDSNTHVSILFPLAIIGSATCIFETTYMHMSKYALEVGI